VGVYIRTTFASQQRDLADDYLIRIKELNMLCKATKQLLSATWHTQFSALGVRMADYYALISRAAIVGCPDRLWAIVR
jgi:hypothetical protein